MTWDDIDAILHDGTAEDIVKIKCPDCGGRMSFTYCRHSDDEGSLSYFCDDCGITALCHLGAGHPTPNCAIFFGNETHINENLKLKQSA